LPSPKFAAQAIRKALEINWKPLKIVITASWANISDVVAAKIARSPARLDFAFAFPTTQSVGVNAEKFCCFGYGNKLTYNA
jgi:hypothetical protein